MSNRVKRFHMYAGVDLVGSKTSMAESRNITLEATSVGIKMHSKTSNRIVVVPYPNIKGFELYPEEQAVPIFNEATAESEDDLVCDPTQVVVAPKRRGRPPKVQ